MTNRLVHVTSWRRTLPISLYEGENVMFVQDQDQEMPRYHVTASLQDRITWLRLAAMYSLDWCLVDHLLLKENQELSSASISNLLPVGQAFGLDGSVPGPDVPSPASRRIAA